MFASNVFVSKKDKEDSFSMDYDEINNEITKALRDMDNEQDKTDETSFQFSFNHFEANSMDSENSFYSNKSANNERICFSPQNNSPIMNCFPNSMHRGVNPNFANFSAYCPNVNSSHCYRKTASNPSAFFNQGSQFFKQNNCFFHQSSADLFENTNYFDLTSRKDKAKQSQKKKRAEVPKNKIYLEKILSLKEKRTTLMIRNIPNGFSLRQFREEININFQNKYDIIYLPNDLENKCNLGFGFINFINPLTIISFYDCFYGQKWNKFNSDKICELAFAKVQGKDDLIKYIENSVKTGEETSYIQETNNIRLPIELPLKYLQAFINIHPYSYRIAGYNKFVIESYLDC